MRSIKFYRTESGKCFVQEFLDSLDDDTAKKITFVLKIIRELPVIPKTYFKNLTGIKDIYECRIIFKSNIYRLLCFFDKDNTIVISHGFIKKTNKTPKIEIEKAIQYKNNYFRR